VWEFLVEAPWLRRSVGSRGGVGSVGHLDSPFFSFLRLLASPAFAHSPGAGNLRKDPMEDADELIMRSMVVGLTVIYSSFPNRCVLTVTSGLSPRLCRLADAEMRRRQDQARFEQTTSSLPTINRLCRVYRSAPASAWRTRPALVCRPVEGFSGFPERRSAFVGNEKQALSLHRHP
jgi:hypothetical protein